MHNQPQPSQFRQVVTGQLNNKLPPDGAKSLFKKT